LTEPPESIEMRSPDLLSAFVRVLDTIDRVLIAACAFATIAAGLVLTHSIAVRYLLHSSTDWQDEMAVFLLAGATFLSAPYVQSVRGHIAIEAIQGFLPKPVERIRKFVSDLICFAFCAFFAWKSWTLAHEAWVDGQVSNSMWSPPLAIPYVLMAMGMTLLCVQILLQIVLPLTRAARR